MARSSNFYSDLRNASSSELTKYYCVNCRCSAVTMPIRSSSYATSSTSELVVSVQLPLNSMFFCHVEVLSHVVLLRQCSRSIYKYYSVVLVLDKQLMFIQNNCIPLYLCVRRPNKGTYTVMYLHHRDHVRSGGGS